MRRHIPGHHSGQQHPGSDLDGLLLVRVDKASYRWHRQKPFLELRFVVLEPKILGIAVLLWTAVLYRASTVEVQLVPDRLWL
jgi:hypothetical protein